MNLKENITFETFRFIVLVIGKGKSPKTMGMKNIILRNGDGENLDCTYLESLSPVRRESRLFLKPISIFILQMDINSFYILVSSIYPEIHIVEKAGNWVFVK